MKALPSTEHKIEVLLAEGWTRHVSEPRIWIAPDGRWYRGLREAWDSTEEKDDPGS